MVSRCSFVCYTAMFSWKHISTFILRRWWFHGQMILSCLEFVVRFHVMWLSVSHSVLYEHCPWCIGPQRTGTSPATWDLTVQGTLPPNQTGDLTVHGHPLPRKVQLVHHCTGTPQACSNLFIKKHVQLVQLHITHYYF